MRAAISDTCALYGATIRMSSSVIGFVSCARFVHVEPAASRPFTIAATRSACSIEEADRVAAIVNGLLAAGSTWTNRAQETNPMTLEDILIVAPYNAQVSEIAARIPGARIGTVDKFQGQEAPVVIYSMATSSPEEAPHGMEFLFSRHRLNVATSRARCVCIFVGNPQLFEPECRTPEQMRMANAFCRYLELASSVDDADRPRS